MIELPGSEPRRAPESVLLVRLTRFAGHTFFQTLRRKLEWGDLAEREGA